MVVDILERKIGVNFNDDGSAEIWLWAPPATAVSVWVNDSKLPLIMKKMDLGYWFLQTSLIKPLDMYHFEICKADGGFTDPAEKVLNLPDPASLFQYDGVAGNSKAFDLKGFNWTDDGWVGLDLQDFIIYELHTGTFTPNGDFESIESKLDYLLGLGITAIELMPIAQFPGNRNWGYDGVFPFAVQNTYGGPLALQHLVNACHKKGLAVILDVVYNHFGPEGNYFAEFGPYFTDKHQTPWGSAINFDDAGAHGVRNYFIENALMWFRDFHIDALRLDAVHAIQDFGEVHILSEIKSSVSKLAELKGKKYELIVELDLNDNQYINPQNKGGYGMDGQWIDEFHHALRVSAGQKPHGYYADFSGVAHLAKSYNDAYVYDGQFSPHRKKHFGKPANGNGGKQFVVFSQNHDQIGNRMLGERTSTLVSFEMLKLLAGAVFCSPFIPLIFMGEEWAETNPFQFFISHSDKDLIAAVRKGRKAEFAAFHHEEDTPDPQSETTFNHSKLDWNRLDTGQHNSLFTYYKHLISLRKTNPILADLNRDNVKAEALSNQQCVLLTRWYTSQKMICLMNFSNQEQHTIVPEYSKDWSLLLDSSSTSWNGPTSDLKTISPEGNIIISPESILIFICDHV
ncbi:malto-oligosyltrehalose trehalohydrolase [Pedobacter yonginense]|nr:malto-oligosyltrehalose trehalohydrolase [Pedobacter yonginense]